MCEPVSSYTDWLQSLGYCRKWRSNLMKWSVRTISVVALITRTGEYELNN